uniref:Large ribosomal subunit protein uL10 n=1 Tax=Ciona savignyi TaxID=51511 RepID=H2YYU3_CIOSA
MPREDRKTWKAKYFIKIIELLDEYPKCFIVGADNVSSKQMQQIRASLRDRAIILMGKNTMMRKAIKGHINNNPDLEKLLPHIKGNVGLVFTKDELTDIRDLLLANKVAAPARAGAIAPNDVIIPAQNTGLGPEKTSFFQALAIPTKISRGTIEIIVSFVRNVAAVCLAIGYPTVASVPHSIINGFKNLLAVAAETDITFPEAEKMKAYLADPTAFAVAAPVATEEKEEAKPAEESEEESDDDMGFGLFD